MSNTNNTMQTQTSNALHNAIMEAGGKDRLPMLASGNYVQWERAKDAEAGFQLNAEQADWRDDTDDEPDDQELEVHYMYMAQIQEVTPDAADNFGPIFDSDPLQKKTQFLNEIDRISREYYYADHMNAILGVYTELDEVTNLQCDYLESLEKCECLQKELSKSKIMSNNFKALQKHAITLELDLQLYLKAQLQDKGIAISELKKLIEKLKGKSVETKLKSSVIRQLNAFKSQRPSILGKPTIFSDSLEKKDCSKSKTKMPMAVPISTREPKHIVNQSVATPLRRILVEIILFIVDSGCSKHMTGNLKLLNNFVEKFLGSVKVGNDQIALILGYGDLVQGTVTIKRVYYVEGLNHNLFSVDQFCDADLEVAFWKSTCYIRDLKGNDLLTGEIEDFKNKNKSLESSNNCFKEANNKLSETNNLLYNDFKKSQPELARRNDVEYASKVEIDCAKARGDLISYKMKSQKSFNKYTQMINDLNQTISEMKNKLSAHQETISILSQQKQAQIKLYKTREDKELDKVIALEKKVKVLDNIVYKTGQSVQTMNMLNNKCRTSFAKPEFLKKAQ
nr:integrase, catalytic region, zinc finger, CCHC-type, peptidase aspartic, catalytic [Tanacetum cinerariifolium]